MTFPLLEILAAFRTAAATATPGPWKIKLMGNGQTAIKTDDGQTPQTLATVWTPRRREDGGNNYAELQGNSELIALARNHIIDLCDENDALRAEVKALKERCIDNYKAGFAAAIKAASAAIEAP